jgi:hypothetical protein
MKYSGIDLHSNNSVVVVTNENDRVIVSKRMPNQLRGIIELLRPHQDELVGVVVESTYNWYWLVDGLQEAGFVVHLANTAAMATYEGLKHGNDESDAINLARTLRLGILPTGLLRTQEGPDQRHRCDQGAGAQIGAGLLSHAQRGQAVRRAQVLCMTFRRGRMSHLRGLAQSHESD